jgi:hypothetical protein
MQPLEVANRVAETNQARLHVGDIEGFQRQRLEEMVDPPHRFFRRLIVDLFASETPTHGVRPADKPAWAPAEEKWAHREA